MINNQARGSAEYVLFLIRRGAEQSPLNYWMVEHHADMIEAGRETRIR